MVRAVNQIEVHPDDVPSDVQDFGAEHRVLTQAWSPIGGVTFYRASDHASTLEDPTIWKDRRVPPQVRRRSRRAGVVQHGRSVIPKSTDVQPHC